MNDISDDEKKIAASEAGYESDYSYSGDESDNMTTGWRSGQKRPSSLLRDEAANIICSSSTDDFKFVMSSEQCHQCLQERHDPVSCCTKVTSWLQRRHQLWTVSPQVLQECVAHYIHTVANRANISEVEAGIMCRNAEWQLDLRRIQPNPNVEAFLEVMQMGARYMEEEVAPPLPPTEPDPLIDPVINGRGDAHEVHDNNELNNPVIENGAAAEVETTATPSQIQHETKGPVQSVHSPLVPNVSDIDSEEGTHSVAPFVARHPPETESTSFGFDGNMASNINGFDGNTASNINTDDDTIKMNSVEPNSVPEDKQPVEGLLTCPICFEDDLAPNFMYAMECGHMFCLDCWRLHVRNILGETHQVVMHSTCPERNCEQEMNEVVIQAVAPECLPLFENHQRHAFVRGSASTVRWCPGPGCDQVAMLPRDNLFEDNVKDFCCGKCSTSFCFTCLRTPHQGVICHPQARMAHQYPAVAMVAGDVAEFDALMDTRDDKLRKQCPSCKAPVEKIGGCNRMLCRCRHAFCWLCLGDYSNYGGHFCGGTRRQHFVLDENRATVDLEFLREALRDKPMDDELVMRTQSALEELDRYAHCYNRYYAHKQGQEFAEGLCPCIVHRKENYTRMADIQTGNEVDFIQSANETLVASRRILKYAYISIFYSKRVDEEDKEHSHLGFLHLESLEGVTEELSGVSENALTRHDRARVLDLIAVVTKCMGLVADFEFHETVANARE